MDSFRQSKRDFLKVLSLSTASFGLLTQIPAEAKSLFSPSSAVTTWPEVRDQFSLTKDRVYFNNGTLGPSPHIVLNSVVSSMREVERTGEQSEEHKHKVREKIARFVGATEDEIALTHNTTEGVNIIAQGLSLESGHEIIITTHEHVGNGLPWLNRARLDGLVIKSFDPPNTASEVVKKIALMITDQTKVIVVPHISCTTGQVFPLEELGKLARQHDIFFFVDGAHGLGMFPLDLKNTLIDAYATCGHKWLCGPKGTGFLYVSKNALEKVDSRFVGAYSVLNWDLASNPPQMSPLQLSGQRFEYGSQNIALFAGLTSAIDFFETVGMEKISEYGLGLARYLQQELLNRSADVEVLTPTEDKSRGMIVSFRFKDPSRAYDKFASFAGQKGFRIRQVPEAGLNCLRISTHLYNSQIEIERFVKVVDEFLKL
jgi:cysteine desulfurase/selenocysteine lyase